jgi:hypothetical protein
MLVEQDLGDVLDAEPQEEEFEKGAVPRRFHYLELAAATKYFSDDLKLGEGGYKKSVRELKPGQKRI